MSHVDKALNASEGEVKIPSGPAPERFRLDQYTREASVTAEAAQGPQSTGPAGLAAAEVEPVAAAKARPNPDLEARLVTGGSGGVSVEQYRRLAASLHDIQHQQGLKTVMLTSSLPNEGKTLTIVNLALTLSELYARRVLIIDADLRWPSVHTVLGVSNTRGLSETLLGGGLELPIRQVSPRLSLLPAGRPGPTPLAALTSVRMAVLIEECAKAFDWVLLDAPPVALMPDAQVLARLTRAVVLVIAAGATPAATVKRSVEELGSESIIGTVLNRVDERRIPDVGYYAHYGDRD